MQTQLLTMTGCGGGSNSRDVLLTFSCSRLFKMGSRADILDGSSKGFLARQQRQPHLAVELSPPGCSRPRAGTPGIGIAAAAAVAVWYAQNWDSWLRGSSGSWGSRLRGKDNWTLPLPLQSPFKLVEDVPHPGI
eukprot:g35479.t1